MSASNLQKIGELVGRALACMEEKPIPAEEYLHDALNLIESTASSAEPTTPKWAIDARDLLKEIVESPGYTPDHRRTAEAILRQAKPAEREVEDGWYTLWHKGYNEVVLVLGGIGRMININNPPDIDLQDIDPTTRMTKDEIVEWGEGNGLQGQWYGDWQLLTEHLVSVQEEKKEG